MTQLIERDYLISHLTKLQRHDKGKAMTVLPFSTKKTSPIKGQFNKVLGDYVRNVCELKLEEKQFKQTELYTSTQENPLSEQIAKTIEFDEDQEDDKYDFIRFLDQYLFNQEEIKPIHPFLFNYMQVKKKNKNENELSKYAHFIRDILALKNNEVKEIFSSKETDDILTELIISNLDALTEAKPLNVEYEPLLSPITKLYQEDLVFLSKYKDYFLTSFPLLTHFYVFMYVCQITLKFEQFIDADFDSLHPIYFALEWESITQRRKAADELEGFKFIKEKSKNLFPHIHAISQISHNSLNKTSGDRVKFIPYSTLYQKISIQGEEFEQRFLLELKLWIKDYLKWANKELEDNSTDLPTAFKVLFQSVKKGTNSEVAERYGKNIEALGANQFLKGRGSIGQVLNIKHDFLLLLTAVSVKDKRIPLNDLFIEFEKRGIAFDRYSKKEIITLLDNLNILDKKSDSGDAQYVKAIL
ncbi:DNA phosphorothioation-dependent restriction protein DptG [Neobacillus drentensis]|uniref:DNA phosphorothioation-dependent restriction protein DptG n=1 Tax=Neobacillus drentensis TaxID=220684 RepID=UPI002FFE9484